MTSRLLKTITVLLSLLVTPIVFFVATSTDLYLRNQADFGYDAGLLLPYAALAIASMSCGIAIYCFSRRRCLSTLLWLYYLAAPCYVLYRVVRKVYWHLTNSILDGAAESALIFCLFILCLAVVLVLYKRKADPKPLVAPFAVIGLLAVCHATYQIASRATIRSSAAGLAEVLGCSSLTKPASSAPRDATSLKPNIYHLILDGFQTDMFEFVFTAAERENQLAGFSYFPDNVTVYGRTSFSIPSTFLGIPFDCVSDQRDYIHSHFDSEQSFLHWLVDDGYDSFGLHSFEKTTGVAEKLFHHTARHGEHVHVRNSGGLFRDAWLVSSFPEVVHRPLVSSDRSDGIRTRSIIPSSQQIKSYLAFQEYLDLEKDLPESNRYTYIHLMIPHPPYILACDCSSPGDGDQASPTAHVEQVMCAKKIILDFLDCLKQLGRYEGSMIVIHGDHGFYARIIGDELIDMSRTASESPENIPGHTDECARARSRALLLIKPPSCKYVNEGFVVSNAPSTLLDVAPTILDGVDVKAPVDYAGFSLLDAGAVPSDRKRYYHFYEFTRIGGVPYLAREMTRWRIEKDSVVRDSTIPLEHTLSDPD